MPIYVQYVHIVEAACWGVEAFGLDSVQIMSIFFWEKQVLRATGGARNEVRAVCTRAKKGLGVGIPRCGLLLFALGRFINCLS
jgi:hypothetical protein